MLPLKRLLVVFIALTLVLVSCTLPSSELSPDDIAATIVAQTQTAEASRATDTPLPPTSTPTPTSTATTSVTTVSVSTATNCRTGPDLNYGLVLVFQPGATAQVVGKYSPSNYWIINTPTGGTCWLWGAYATVQGDTNILSEMAAPPPPVAAAAPTTDSSNGDSGDGGNGGDGDSGSNGDGNPSIGPILINPGVIGLLLKPAMPEIFTATAKCTYITMLGNKIMTAKKDTLSWSSVSSATGYKLYVNGIPMNDVGSGTTSASFDAFTLSSSSYGIAAYNANGDSSIKTIPAPKCP